MFDHLCPDFGMAVETMSDPEVLENPAPPGVRPAPANLETSLNDAVNVPSPSYITPPSDSSQFETTNSKVWS